MTAWTALFFFLLLFLFLFFFLFGLVSAFGFQLNLYLRAPEYMGGFGVLADRLDKPSAVMHRRRLFFSATLC